jgi:ankyrin repeat protein
LEEKDGTGERAVHITTRNGRLECLAYLLSIGADPHSRNDDGYTALHWACMNGRLAELKLLFQYVTDVDPRYWCHRVGDRETETERERERESKKDLADGDGNGSMNW